MLSQETLQPDFDVDRYLGVWYEIAKLPTFFGVGCSSAKAQYERIASNAISVLNTCLDDKGKGLQRENPQLPGTCLDSWIFGTGIIQDPDFPSAISVNFPSSPQPQTNAPNYLVHKTNYTSYSVVGSPNRQGLFILSRTPTMSKKKYNSLVRFAKSLGYNTNNLMIDQRDGRPVVQ